jgi:hypothetical protein
MGGVAAQVTAPPQHCHAGATSHHLGASAAASRAKKQTAFDLSKAANEDQLPGNDLLSHTLAHAVPSALRGLTAVFGMGTGVSPSPQPPEKRETGKN